MSRDTSNYIVEQNIILIDILCASYVTINVIYK
jgi:hypothetical protein